MCKTILCSQPWENSQKWVKNQKSTNNVMSNHGWHTEVIDLSDIYLAVPWCFLDTSFVLPSNTATQDTKVVYVLMISNLGEDLSELVLIEFVWNSPRTTLYYVKSSLHKHTGISVDYRNPWMVTMDGRQDYSSMSMRRAPGSIIKKCQESSNDVILSSQRDLKQFCSLNHVNLMSALM